MAQDRPYEDADGPEDARPDQHSRRRGAAARPSPPAEARSHEEYYEALRAADGSSARAEPDWPAGDGSAEPRRESEGSGWDSVDATDRPSLDALRVSPERRTHILDGDADSNGGGHRHGTGRPGKTEFPATWDDEKIIASILDVARRPDKPPVRQDWNTWLCYGTRDNVEVWAVVEPSADILTGWPEEGGPGVVRNPRKGK